MKTDKLFAITGMINYIVVVFLNAFTDLGHKIIIQNTVFKVYDGDVQIMLTAIVNALILLPFILLFSPAGYLSDRFSKTKIMRYSALFAVVITLGITFAYYQGWFIFAFVMTFLLALQSALYSPAKYGYIKELAGVKFISSANAAVQAITTVAILGGIVFYSALFEMRYSDILLDEGAILKAIAPIGWLLVIASVVEYLLALRLPDKEVQKTSKVFTLRRYLKGLYLVKNLKTITRKKEIFDAILALSLFWSISQVVLAIFGEYAKSNLGVTNTLYVQGVMALAGVGMVIGSVMAAKLSRHYINVGLAGVGSVCITLIVFVVPFMHSMALLAFLFTLFGVFSGFLMVPLNARIQYLAPNVHLGTVLAANNFVQNIFMFTFLVLTTLFAYFGFDSIVLFYAMGVVGIVLSGILFKRYLVDIFWAFVGMLLSLVYKIEYIGLENIPQEKGVLLLGNHVSWVDWALLQIGMARRINFMMDKAIYEKKFLKPVLQKGEVIPLSPKAFKDAFKEASKRLKEGRVVALFPEGGIAWDAKLSEFHRGFELIDKEFEGVVVPFFITGMYGSIFARHKEQRGKKLFHRRVVRVVFGEPLPKDISAKELQKVVETMKEKYEIK